MVSVLGYLLAGVGVFCFVSLWWLPTLTEVILVLILLLVAAIIALVEL